MIIVTNTPPKAALRLDIYRAPHPRDPANPLRILLGDRDGAHAALLQDLGFIRLGTGSPWHAPQRATRLPDRAILERIAALPTDVATDPRSAYYLRVWGLAPCDPVGTAYRKRQAAWAHQLRRFVDALTDSTFDLLERE